MMKILVEPGGDSRQAEKLARQLNVSLFRESMKDLSCRDFSEPVLRFHSGGLSLAGDGLEMQGDLTHMLPRLRKGNLEREFLVKASRMKNLPENPRAID
ncbi:MAG: hypothetical protein IKX76_04930, partial [Eubacterium sp.]|nr:hypothetical protein [Eubacterium sp.]